MYRAIFQSPLTRSRTNSSRNLAGIVWPVARMVSVPEAVVRIAARSPLARMSSQSKLTSMPSLSDAGKHERVFEVGEALLPLLGRIRGSPIRAANVHLSMAQAAVAGARLAEASQHLEQARQLDVADRARGTDWRAGGARGHRRPP